MAGDRRALWLGAVAIVAIVAVIVVWSGGDGAPAAVAPTTRGAGRTAPTTDTQPPAEVNLKVLARERSERMDLGRNPFRFRPRPAPQPPAPVPGPGSKAAGGLTPTPGGNAPVGPPAPPAPPAITLKFIGLVEKADGTRIAVLSDGKRPITGREGEEIEGRYRIVKIGIESIEISYLDGRGRQTIKLTGQ